MTKAELIKALEPYDDDMEVVFWDNEWANYEEINTIRVITVERIRTTGEYKTYTSLKNPNDWHILKKDEELIETLQVLELKE
jgi:hypothetical protein